MTASPEIAASERLQKVIPIAAPTELIEAIDSAEIAMIRERLNDDRFKIVLRGDAITLLRALDAERAAVAELRELLCTHYLMWSAAGESTEWSFLKRMKSCPDADLDAALTEFRKHKEPAK